MAAEIVPGVFVTDHQIADGKNVVIFGRNGTLAVDSGTYPHEAQIMIDLIRERGREPDQLIYTHGHGDHVMGSGPFKGAHVYAHALTPAEIWRILPLVAARLELSLEAAADLIAWPTITFSDELAIDLGDRQVRLFPTPGHSQDGISLYLESERLLIAGDAVVTGIVPAIGDGDSRVLEASLRRVASMDIAVLQPGHGRTLVGEAQVQEWLAWAIGYLHSIRLLAREELAAGTPPERIADLADYEAYVGDRLPIDAFGMARRHRAAVAKIIAEESRPKPAETTD
jgi:glyoxylase-like metal-dependent hydrolase (beta-lactamase superfamily II)